MVLDLQIRPTVLLVQCWSYLRSFFFAGIAPLSFFVTAIAAEHILVESVSLGRHSLVLHVMHGARLLRPFCPISVPSLDLSCLGRAH